MIRLTRTAPVALGLFAGIVVLVLVGRPLVLRYMGTESRIAMTPFDYVAVSISIVMRLGVAHILTGFAATIPTTTPAGCRSGLS